MKYTVDTALKTIELHEPLTITEIVGLLTHIKNGMDYKVIGYNPQVITPSVPWTDRWITPYDRFKDLSTPTDHTGTAPYLHHPTVSQIIGDVMLEHKDSDIKSFSFPGGFGFAISSKEEEQ